jgi:hypothetical protein
MCCSFNMKSADDIFQGHLYSSLVNQLQQDDKGRILWIPILAKCFWNILK